MNQPKTKEQRNNAVIRELYASGKAASKDTPKPVQISINSQLPLILRIHRDVKWQE